MRARLLLELVNLSDVRKQRLLRRKGLRASAAVTAEFGAGFLLRNGSRNEGLATEEFMLGQDVTSDMAV
ncbi:hypothetical protein V1504DRAFT_432062 [Lipomyces starkeyi]